jgi:PAS domain S-box-containing protein
MGTNPESELSRLRNENRELREHLAKLQRQLAASDDGDHPAGVPHGAGAGYTPAGARDLAGHHQALKSLREANQRLEMVLAASKAGWWDWRIASGEVEWALELYTLFGLDPLRTPNPFASWEAILHPEDKEGALLRLQRALAEKSGLANEYRILLPDGKIRWISALGQGIYDDQGRPVRMLGICIDISDRKRAEAELRESLLFRREAEKIARIGAWKVNPRTDYLFWTEGVYEIIEAPADYKPGGLEEGMELYNAESITLLREAITQALADGTQFAIEVGLTTFTGKHLWTEVRGLGRLEEENSSFVMGTFQDITERKRAEQALRDSEVKYRRLHESITDAVVAVDMDGHIVESNPAYQGLLGYTGEELCRLTYQDLTPGKWHAIEARILAEQVLGRGYSDVYEKEYCRRDGTALPVELRSYLVRDEDGSPVSMWATVRDISERKHQESDRESILHLLRLINSNSDLHELMREVTLLLQGWSGCEAVGVRLRDGADFPYFETRGFPAEFVQMENSLCSRDPEGDLRRDSAGNPVLECMCGNVLCGRFDPGKPFFSKSGSFWTSGTSRLLASTTEADRQARTRNRCNGEGYESVALIPLRTQNQTLGLLQCNDRREGRFTARKIAVLERMAASLSVALAQRQALQRLQQSEARYRSLFSGMTAGFVQCQPIFEDGRAVDGVYLEVNEAFEKLIGVRNLVGRRISEFHPGLRESDPALIEACGRVALTGQPERFELFLNALQTWLSVSAYSPAAGQVVVLLEPITDRKRAEAELEQSNLQLQLAVASGGMGIWAWDVCSDTLVWDERMFELYGRTRGEVSSCYETWRSAVHPEDRVRANEAIQAALRDEKRYDLEFRVAHPDGSVRHIKADALVERDGDGRAVRMIGLNRDITESKLAEAERERLHSQLAQAQKMESIGRLAGGVAHDFNNLLTVINGYSEMALAGMQPGEPLAETLREILKAGKRAAALTRQLLAFSRKQILRPRVLEFDQVVGEMRSMLERLMGEDVEVRIELRAPMASVSADPHQLEQVIMNLAVNARDAMPGGGSLLISTEAVTLQENDAAANPGTQPGAYVMLAVTDTGVGMDEATRQRVFEPFFTTKEVGQGTGLGLSMVQGIVAQSSGYVGVTSAPGDGTTFRVYLPAVGERPAGDERPPAAPALKGNETILVVEDQTEVRNFALAALNHFGYRVLQASDAAEALAICEQGSNRIDLVLTDVIMPGMSGPELVASLEKIRPGIKTLFMSGYTDKMVLQHGVAEEGAHFIQKPFSPEQLAITVREVLGPPRRERILLVDDEDSVRRLLCLILSRAGYEVTEAANGREAIREVRKSHIDLVITDLVMPEQEGIETIRILRQQSPGTRIIAISGAAGGRYLDIADALGADAILPKPIAADVLAAKVREVLSGGLH